MCGIIGLVAQGPVNQALFDGLTVLQHRGQDAAGMVTCHQGRLILRKDIGLVRDVIRTRHMRRLRGNIGIGHVRYPTAGVDSDPAEAQPFFVNSPFGITLAHNGNLTNAAQLKQALFATDLRHINTDSDSEILLNVLAHELHNYGQLPLQPRALFQAVAALHRRVRGAYAAVALIIGHGILAFRDPNGIRPLVFGRRETAAGTEYLVASETVALDTLGFELIRDVAPGEAVLFTEDGRLLTQQCAQSPRLSPCIFEYVYLARPDSFVEGVSVHKARLRMGNALAARIQQEWADHDIDAVIPIPDSSRSSALQVALKLGVKYREGFVKNRYIARTFIMPGQAVRQKSVRQKLNAIDQEFRSRNVLLVDDSIVRGNTARQIVQMARDAGARRVYFGSAAPPVRYPNVYGIDMPSVDELVAHGRNVTEIADAIGVDRLVFQELEDLEQAVRLGNPELSHFDCSCFNGEYLTGDVDSDYLAALQRQHQTELHNRWLLDEDAEASNVLDLHNGY